MSLAALTGSNTVLTFGSCQCGISRSATMLVAYLMVLAIGGLVPERLGHLKGMQDTYDMAKRQSPWIGPNVS